MLLFVLPLTDSNGNFCTVFGEDEHQKKGIKYLFVRVAIITSEYINHVKYSKYYILHTIYIYKKTACVPNEKLFLGFF